MNCSNVRPVGAEDVWEEAKNEAINWPLEQDCYLTNLISSYGKHSWSLVADQINRTFPGANKTSKQCRERWQNKLDTEVNRTPWTKQEEAQLILSHMRLRNHWRDIALTLKGRHNNMVKNLFYSIFRRVKNKLLTRDFSCKSKLEVLEVHYILSLMELYIHLPISDLDLKRKRGKDFLHTLVADLDPSQLLEFKAGINVRFPLKASLEQLLTEMSSASRSANPARPVVPPLALPCPRTPESAVSCQLSQPPIKLSSNSCSQSILLTLPLPLSFSDPGGLLDEDKQFIQQHFFPPSGLKTAALPSPQQPGTGLMSEVPCRTVTQFQSLQPPCMDRRGADWIMDPLRRHYLPFVFLPGGLPFYIKPCTVHNDKSPALGSIVPMQTSQA